MVAKTIALPIYPWEYTSEEGGVFKPWLAGPVTMRELSLLQTRDLTCILLNTVMLKEVIIHCLIFESSAAGPGMFARWDCINGWTTTLEVAKRNFPNGLNGRKPPYGS